VSQGVTTTYIYSGSQVIAEYVGTVPNVQLAREYILSGDTIVASHDGGTLRYHHFDHLSMRLTTDSAGSIIGNHGHYPYGEEWYNATWVSKRKFTTYEWDAGGGQYYAINRYYPAATGRFGSPDRLGGTKWNPQSLNRYGYVMGDPVNLYDPLGLESKARRQEPSGLWWSSEWGSADGGGDGGGEGECVDPDTGETFPCYQEDPVITTATPDPYPKTGMPEWMKAKYGAPDGMFDFGSSGRRSGGGGGGRSFALFTSRRCPPVPAGLTHALLQSNMMEASIARSAFGKQGSTSWFYEKVRNATGRVDAVRANRSWDYKQVGFEEFGNFNYGATAHSLGLSRLEVRAGSAFAHVKAHGWNAFTPSNVFNEVKDQIVIDRGFRYAANGCP
jgi:RHS repeat-associated protein